MEAASERPMFSKFLARYADFIGKRLLRHHEAILEPGSGISKPEKVFDILIPFSIRSDGKDECHLAQGLFAPRGYLIAYLSWSLSQPSVQTDIVSKACRDPKLVSSGTSLMLPLKIRYIFQDQQARSDGVEDETKNDLSITAKIFRGAGDVSVREVNTEGRSFVPLVLVTDSNIVLEEHSSFPVCSRPDHFDTDQAFEAFVERDFQKNLERDREWEHQNLGSKRIDTSSLNGSSTNKDFLTEERTENISSEVNASLPTERIVGSQHPSILPIPEQEKVEQANQDSSTGRSRKPHYLSTTTEKKIQKPKHTREPKKPTNSSRRVNESSSSNSLLHVGAPTNTEALLRGANLLQTHNNTCSRLLPPRRMPEWARSSASDDTTKSL